MSGPKVVSRKDFEAKIVANAWRDASYKKRLLKNPKAVVQDELQEIEAGVELPKDLSVAVHEESPEQYHLVLPRNPNEIAPGAVEDQYLEAIAPQTIAVVVVNQVAVIAGPVVNVVAGPAVNVNLAQITNTVTSFVSQIAAQVNTVS
ncbi:MAG: NHLP leader peptide family RiPP precursor [Thermoanaerobaculia bacterium]